MSSFWRGRGSGFVSLMSSRLAAVIVRIRALNAIPQDDPARAHLRADVQRLRRRAQLLSSGMHASLVAGICATLLLAIIFTV
ncbi:MAG: DUF2721 domain-containing protein [Methylocystis sp.]|uniref:DUF2721 domain-containing protein n=1 Tax=Methylocystis sp. TaxID=1911079 RepID=UPI003DA53132